VTAFEVPPRYEAVSPLGKGGGGEVWAVRDRITGATLALKALLDSGSEREVHALVREAVALSGLEGLGAPRVLRFGRLPDTGRAFMVRELVEGRSLLDLFDDGVDPRRCLTAMARAADQLTVLHRASLLHGDVKPANIIVSSDGTATLVDLGLAAPWKEGGIRPEGLTPRYAAPELFTGAPLGVRVEIFALGATLEELLQKVGGKLGQAERTALERVAARAMAADPSARFPSADELATELRRAAGLAARERLPGPDASWPIVAIDAVSVELCSRIEKLKRGGVLLVEGPTGAGKTALMRRNAWSLGVEGRPVAWIEPATTADVSEALDIELVDKPLEQVTVLVDDADKLTEALCKKLTAARKAGARLVLAAPKTRPIALGAKADTFPVPPLESRAATELLRRAIPSLSDAVIAHMMVRSHGRPGRLRSIVRTLEGHTVVSPADLDRILEPKDGSTVNSVAPEPAIVRSSRLLDQGRSDEAALIIAELSADQSLAACIARARLALARGDANAAIEELNTGKSVARREASSATGRSWALYLARAHLRLGNYPKAERWAETARAAGAPQSIESEALSVQGLAESYTGRHEVARATLQRAVELAKSAKDRRVEGVALTCLAMALYRSDRLTEAKSAYEAGLNAAEQAGDAGSVATIRLNLAALARSQGDFAYALSHLQAAVDMGKRAGRESTMQQALLNLANLDLYLGRFARARTSIELLAQERDSLAPGAQAQLLGLEGDLAACTDNAAAAIHLYEGCAQAYGALGRGIDSAEAMLEGVLLAARMPGADAKALGALVEKAAESLGNAPAHRAMMALARGSVDLIAGNQDSAKKEFEQALTSARAEGQKEWIWRALENRSRLAAESGQSLAARRDREEALSTLEEIAGRLPRDLREVFWDDARRRQLRSQVTAPPAAVPSHRLVPAAQVALTQAPSLDDRLARLLEITRDLAAEHDLPRLLERVTDHAIALLRAERGFVILVGEGGKLSVHASRDQSGNDPHAIFSRSIAEKVVSTGDAVISLSARDDERMAGYLSVHQLMLQSVACVPISAPGGKAAGALYVETRLRPGVQFADELPILRAFADQVAIAIENARLMTESAEKARELQIANEDLLAARARLEGMLGQRTAQLDEVRRDLRSTKAVLRSHFGYQGLVGTSKVMRKVYALVDRIKDTDVPVLLTGESGTGKEIVARAIHNAGPRGKAPFTGLNCGAIPEHLLESELFGHVRGAFTGADRDRKGLFRETEGGTLLLDEIGELPKKMQPGLLRVLQEKVVRPVGSPREQPVDVRVIAATNKDLSSMVEQGTFREDLYYRLNVVQVHLPALRERLDDLPVLIDHFLTIFAARFGREKKAVSREALRKLSGYAWPGNVRQLENVLLNAWVMSERSDLGPDELDLPVPGRSTPPPSNSRSAPSSSRSTHSAVSSSRRSNHRDELGMHKQGERERILAALRSCNWNRVKAASALGLPRRTFYRRLKQFGIQ
jgi:serine/threonine-protein kinase PknK